MPSWSYPPEAGGGGGGGGTATACEIDVADYPGADLGAKLQAAIDALPATGGVLTCECLAGAQTISSTVTVNKPVKIKFGASVITVTASPGIHVPEVGTVTNKPIIDGAGPETTVFEAQGGVTPIFKIQGDETEVRNLGITYLSDDPSNVAIELSKDAAATFGLLRPVLYNITALGNGSGSGFTISICFGGNIQNCDVGGFLDGLRVMDDGINSSTAYIIEGNRFHHNLSSGIRHDNGLDFKFFSNTIEGNANYGLHIVDGQGVISSYNYYEQLNLANVYIEPAPDAFQRNYFFVEDGFLNAPGPIGVHLAPGSLATQTAFVRGGIGNSGHKAEGSGRIFIKDYVRLNDANVGNVLNEAFWIGLPTHYVVAGISGYSYDFTAWDAVNFDGTVVWQPTVATSFYWRSPTETNLMVVNATANTVSIGIASSVFGRFVVADTGTSVAAVTTKINIYSAYTITPTGASASDFVAVGGDAVAGGTFNITGAVHGAYGDAYWTSAANTLSTARGVRGRVLNEAAGVISEGYAFYARVLNNAGGQITYAAGLLVDAALNNAGAGGTMPNYYGVIIYKPISFVGLTNSYGILLDDYSGATAALWVTNGLSHFGGMIRVGGETTGLAGTVAYTNTVDNSANSTGVGTILLKGATNRDSSGFLKILDGVTPRYIPYFDAITG